MANQVNNAYPIFDGIAPSWADVQMEISATGAPLLKMEDFKAINSASAIDVGEQRGATGGRVKKRTTGAEKLTSGATIYQSGFLQLLDMLSNIAPKRGDECVISLVHFNLVYRWTPLTDSNIYEIRLGGCRLIGDDSKTTEGTDADTVECVLSIIKRTRMVNGKKLVML
jgi:hypothetical protein